LRAKAPSSSANDKQQQHEYRIEPTKIKQDLKEKFDGKGSPDESVDRKLYQLKRLQSMDDGYQAGEMRKCLLSFYLMHTREQRRAQICQLEWALENNYSKDALNWTAQRLCITTWEVITCR
jgi:hypothetical protein